MHYQGFPALAAVLAALALTTGCNPDSSGSSPADDTDLNPDSNSDTDDQTADEGVGIEVVGLRTQVESMSDNYHDLYPDHEFYRTLRFQVAVAGDDLPGDVHSIEAWYPQREEWSHLTDTAILVGEHSNDMHYSDGVFSSSHLFTPASWGGGPDVYQRLHADGWKIRVTDREGEVHLHDLTLDRPPEDADSDPDFIEALQYQDANEEDIRALGLVSGTIQAMSAETVTMNISYQDPRIRSFTIVVYSALAEEDGELRPLGETVEYRMEDLNIEADGQPLQLTFSRDDLAWWGRPDNPEQEYFTSDIVEYRIYASSARVEKDGFAHPSAAFRSIHRYELPRP